MPAIFLSSNLVALSLLLALFLGLFLWFLELIKRQEFFFPAVAILKKEKKKPKISFKAPPFIPLLCSLVTLLCLLLYSFKPYFFAFKPSLRSTEPLHIFVDLSPSLSASYTLEEYKNEILSFYKKERKNYKITFSSSLSEKIYTEEESSLFLENLRFHKKKTLISKEISQIVTQLPNVNLFMIFGDQEESSWKDFFWKSLNKEKKISLSLHSKIRANATNIFVSSVSYIGKKRGLHNWEIKISSSHPGALSQGTLWLRVKEKEFPKKQWTLSPGEDSLYISYSLEDKEVESFEDKEILTWTLEPEQKDLIKLDNNHETLFTKNTKSALLIADPEGESQLEDPASHLEIMLKLFDIQVKRQDKLLELESEEASPPFFISFIKEDSSSFNSYCPTTRKKDFKKIWLAPAKPYNNYNALCSCLSTLLESKNFSCSSFLAREDFSKILKEKSFKQVGGGLGMNESALAWTLEDETKDTSLTLFLIPLFPSKTSGLNHSKFPILLSLLLDEKESPKEKLAWILENVDPGESELHQIAEEKLPPLWEKEAKDNYSNNFSKEKKSIPLVISLLSLMLLALLVESFYHLSQKKVLLILPFFLALSLSEKAFPNVELSYYKAEKNLLNIKELSLQLEDVTSIQMRPDLKNFSSITPALFEEPWMWMNENSLSDFLNKKESLENLSSWIHQGGILLIEGNPPENSLEKIEESLFSRKKISWESISLDHELLRSFFLLKSLPSCKGKNWSILEYEDRVAAIQIPFKLLSSFSDKKSDQDSCLIEKEKLFQIFVNITMVALTLDYKKDQIHLDEILKRLN